MYIQHSLLATVSLSPFVLGVSLPLYLVQRRAMTPAADLPLEWSYKGCFVDRVGKRALYRAMTSSAEMSGGLCARWCAQQGYAFAGTEWSREVSDFSCEARGVGANANSASADTTSLIPSRPRSSTVVGHAVIHLPLQRLAARRSDCPSTHSTRGSRKRPLRVPALVHSRRLAAIATMLLDVLCLFSSVLEAVG